MAVNINMYGLKYEFSRTSTNGADILITIHKKWYEGEVIKRALGRAPIIKRENKDHIYGTSCELYLECKVDGEFAEMYTSDPYEYRVSVYKNDTLLWIGYVSPELYSEPDIAPPYDVQVIATDGLGELKNKDFEKRGVASLLSHFNYLIGAAMPFSIVSDLRYEDENGVEVAAKEILNIKVNLDHESGENCYDVLQHLLKSLNANITQLNGRYLIFRETDFITKASDAGVEAFDVNGDEMVLPIAMFGSMRSHQWWPVGQLSTVVEPAKNKVTLTAPDNYKNNVLNFASCSLINASYLEKEGAYSLPNKNSAITQSLDFGGQEVGYRLGLRVRARNVGAGQYGGTSDKAQNLGLKVEMEGRAFADYLGPNFWLIKSEGISSGSPLADYMWKSSGEGSVEEELRNPSSADSAADAQNIDIVLPLFDDGTNTYGSYAYAKKIKVTIFNPAGEHGIYVYDVSLVKYEQIKGYQADVVIDNAAREAGSDVELTLSPGIYAPAAAEVFMTGLPLQQSGHDIITQWKVGDGQMREYLTAMSYDYSRAVALPKMKYAGILNVPGSEALLPILFLRDGTYYFPKTYSYDLYADEITVELLSISAADVSLGSVVISQTSEASGTMGGVTTGGTSGGGGAVSVPRDKEMSDTSDNAVENRVIKAYVDDLRDQLLDLWHIDKNGNLVTDKQILIKNNLIVENDTSSGGDGQDTPSAGLDEEQLQNYLDLHKYVTESRVQEMIDEVAAGDVDLTNYYTKQEVDAKIPSLDGYAKEEYVDDAITALNVGQYAKASDLENLQGEVDNIETVLGLSETAEGYINTWAEVVAFLDGYKNADDLATILSGINADIAKNAESIATLDNGKADKATTLAGYGITDAYTKSDLESYKTWWDAVMGLVVKDGNNIRIKTNLIVEGDTSSGGSGQDTPASGTVTGVTVGSTNYTDVNAGLLNLTTLMGLYTPLSSYNGLASKVATLEGKATAVSFTQTQTSGTKIGSITIDGVAKNIYTPTIPTKVSAFTNDSGYITGITKSMVASALGASTGGRYLIDTGGDVSWANVPTKLSQFTDDVVSGKYLPLSGGTIGSGLSNSFPLLISSTNAYTGLAFYTSGGTGYIRFQGGSTWGVTDAGWNNSYTLIHSGNIGSYAFVPKSDSLISNVNADNYLSNGVYLNQTGKGSGNSNFPSSYSAFLSFSQSSNYAAQISIGSNAIYMRRKIDSWSHWMRIIAENENGNVLIGTATDSGYKLDVNGPLRIMSIVTEFGDEINRYDGDLHLQYRGTGGGSQVAKGTRNVTMCANGGNVLIGTATDSGYKLDVNGPLRIMSIVTEFGDEINRYDGDLHLQYRGTGGGSQVAKGTRNVTMCANGGNVLIGTTTDLGYKLDVSGNARITNSLELGAGRLDKYTLYSQVSGVKLIDKDNVERLGLYSYNKACFIENMYGGVENCGIQFFDSGTIGFFGGNVGIGTASPQYKLDVNGEVRATTFRFYDDYRSRITLNSSYIDIISAGNEMCIGTNSGDETMHINYRSSTGAGTAKVYRWNAGSSSSWAEHIMGKLQARAITITSTDAIEHLGFSRVGFNYVSIPKGGTLAFAHDNLSQAGSTLYMSEGQVNINGNLVVSGDVASA